MFRFRHIFLFYILLTSTLTEVLQAQAWKEYPYTPEGSLISFPVDEGWHSSEDIEWWYIAGHLEGTTSGTPYSFMLTYFYYPKDTLGFSFDGFRILNMANDLTGEFHTETMVLNYADLATDHLHIDARLLNFVNEYWFHKEESGGTLIPFEYELSATAGANSISLSTISRKAPLIPGGDGLFNQGANSYTYYYSLTESSVEGTLTFEGSSEAVAGTAWIDRQYGSFNPHTEEQYEWFFLQLSNGMDLNIWNLFTAENQLPDDSAYRHLSVYVDDATQYTTHDFELERLSWASMPLSGNVYAQSWSLSSEINQLDLIISTLHHNSEVRLPFDFFEGPTSVSGSVNGSPVSGQGFAELLKSYVNPQLEITRPGKEWNENFPIVWEVQNPDDARPLLFDLAYSTSGEEPWTSIMSQTSDTLFYWNDHPFVNGDSCWFRVMGYTADEMLQSTVVSSVSTRYSDEYTSINRNNSSIDEQSFQVLYPNPAGDRIWLPWSAESDKKYSIMDLSGRLILQGIAGRGGIDIHELESGVYLFRVDESEQSWVQHFIKK